MTHTVTTDRERTTRPVAALLRSAQLAARARDAIGQLEVYAARDACLRVLGRTTYSALIVQVDPEGSRTDLSAIVRARSEFVRLPILAYIGPGPGATSLVADAVRAGSTSVLMVDRDDSPHMFRREVLRIARQALQQRIYTAFVPVVSRSCHGLLRYGVDHLGDARSVVDVANDLGVDRKTPNNWLLHAGLPPLREFLTWIRLAGAVELLAESSRSASQIALDLGFASGPALRQLLDRYFGLSSTAARGIGLEDVIEAFRGSCHHERGEESASMCVLE
jgi:AraC-like DNA-binding protein